ncbi:oxidized low-density lipoprotein receptor 1 isoform X1 [Poecilia formosa]|uniref:oxidized low-density lipoprotein receptor 1 isoform X1 n=2 Tax=Poecilia formosa TaxID=48698 RepID=UPI000443979D|nr:PREDICTED: asialoglycoprotein receptor 1 isoform X1 [Poecilia formosa]XP_016519979.1 PREDICTED: asialoglycoprotein receptor 1 isoform X1 [Poecilia formosa]
MDDSGDSDSYPAVTSNNRKYSRESEAAAEEEEEKEQTSSSLQSRIYLAGLGIFCILVAGTAIYMSVEINKQQEKINDLTTEKRKITEQRKIMKNQELSRVSQAGEELFRKKEELSHMRTTLQLVKGDRALLRREMEELSRETEQLSQKTDELNQLYKEKDELSHARDKLTQEIERLTRERDKLSQEREELKESLEFIQKFDTFSVKDNCPNKRCKPCLQDWIIFKKKCYLFYNEPAPWKTWEQSRRFCQDRRADLVVIDDLEEQEFVNKHINHDKHNGYWMGLQHLNSKWTWVDGRADTLGFWMKQTVTTPAPKALVVPRQNPSESWKKADNVFLNKFICEHNARLRSN